MKDYTLEYMRENKLLTGNRLQDRRTYILTNWLGDIDPDEPLDAELEASLPQQFQMDPVVN